MTVRGRPPPGRPRPPRVPTPPYDTAAEALEAQIPTNGVPLGMEFPTPVDGVPFDVPPEVSVRYDEAAPVREMVAEPGSDQADTAPRCNITHAEGRGACGRPVIDLGPIYPDPVFLAGTTPNDCARGQGSNGWWSWCTSGPTWRLECHVRKPERRGR